ncbi:MAG: hypothetical protein WCK47_12120 [bacterium]
MLPDNTHYSAEDSAALIESELRLRRMRMKGAVLGLMFVVAGGAMALSLFAVVIAYLNDADAFRRRLDKWEVVIRGSSAYVESAAPENRASTPEKYTAQPEDSSITKKFNAVVSSVARPGAVLFFFLAGLLLVSLSIGLIDAGSRLVALAAGDFAASKKPAGDKTQK